MRKYNKIAMIVAGALSFAGVANANEIESGNLNKELSKQRVEISLLLMENKKYDAELESLRKQQEIKQIQYALDGTGDVNNTATSTNNNVDHSVQFDETLNDEDILSESNNWEQNVGFVYQDDVSISIPSSSSPVSSLTAGGEESQDFTKILMETMENINEEEKESAEDHSTPTSISNDQFKLTSISLSKLSLYDNVKEAEVKAQFLVDNGFQKISGAKIVKVKEGQKFSVKNEAFFKVITITEEGVELLNTETEDTILIQK